MSTNAPQFLTYQQAVEAAKKEPDVEFIGLGFKAPYRHLSVYFIYVDSEDLDYVNIWYDGGLLFDSCGEEECYGEQDVPVEAKALFYVKETSIGSPSIRGTMSEYVLAQVLPGLRDPESYPSKKAFTMAAVQAFSRLWRQA